MVDSKGDSAVLSSTQTAVNQNAWIASIMDQLANKPDYSEMKLVTVAYGEEKADVNAQKAKELVQAYPNIKGIVVPAGIGLPAAAEALSQSGDLGKIKVTGLANSSMFSGVTIFASRAGWPERSSGSSQHHGTASDTLGHRRETDASTAIQSSSEAASGLAGAFRASAQPLHRATKPFLLQRRTTVGSE